MLIFVVMRYKINIEIVRIKKVNFFLNIYVIMGCINFYLQFYIIILQIMDVKILVNFFGFFCFWKLFNYFIICVIDNILEVLQFCWNYMI